MRPTPVGLLVALLVMTACTSGGAEAETETSTASEPIIPTPGPVSSTVPAQTAGPASRLANEPDPVLPENGWIAVGEGGDVWLVSLDEEPRRVIGSDADGVDELCPAFSPDGRRLAYGRWEGESVALAVMDVDADGRVSDPVTIDVGDGLPAPCPVWSPDGSRIAFGVARTSPVNPTTSAAGSEVRIVTLSDSSVTALPDLLATDLEWSPSGSLLAIASGVDDVVRGERLQDGRIYLYALASGAIRAIDATLGASSLTWSPDGRRIAYEAGDSSLELRVVDIATERQDVLATYRDFYGIGPVWSPDGEWILVQRCSGACGFSSHEMVLLPVGDLRDDAETAGEVVLRSYIETADATCRLIPRGVTWSPDGRYLLHNGESASGLGGSESCGNLAFLANIPIDVEEIRSAWMQSDGELVVDLAAARLTEPDLSDSDGRFDERSLAVPIQAWGTRPSDPAPAGDPNPNGWVAFGSDQTGSGGIYLVRPGEVARALDVPGSDTADESCPTWSPDGTRLMFGRSAGSSDTTLSDAELVIVPVDQDGTAGAATVIPLEGFDVLEGFDAHPCGVWAPDSRWVAFSGTGDVWVVDTQTGEIRRVPDLRPIDIEWRPGTDQLAITGDLGKNRAADWLSTPVNIYSVSTDEVDQFASVEASNLTWSPDGSTLAYVGGRDQDGMWLVDADGSNARMLVADTGSANHGIGPVWSPSGDRIVYQRLIQFERHEVVLVSVADGSQTAIAPPRTGGSGRPVRWYPWTVTWSPDGSTLLYTAWSDASGSTEQQGVLVVPADTPSEVTLLTDSNRGGDGKSHQWVWTQMWGRNPGWGRARTNSTILFTLVKPE